MDEKKLIQQWKKDEKAPFKGWNFSYLEGRWKGEKLTFGYMGLAQKLLMKSNSVLEMATGGGEFFSKIIKDHKPQKVIAIESFKPNVAVAKKKLSKFGAKVIYAKETEKLPFKDREFDLVLNRHGGLNKYSAKEIYRILSPGGIFLTQQVDGRNLKDLMKEFDSKPKWPKNTLKNVRKYIANAGFKITKAHEWTGKVTFKDAGAIVYFLKAIPWIADDFSVNKHLTILKKLHKKIEKEGSLSYASKRFIILAEK